MLRLTNSIVTQMLICVSISFGGGKSAHWSMFAHADTRMEIKMVHQQLTLKTIKDVKLREEITVSNMYRNFQF